MADVRPFRGLVFNPEHIRLGGVLAPPYDVISDAQREQLYARDLRNIVRIDDGVRYPTDVAGGDDRYTRARGHFVMPDGSPRRRVGLLATVAARPWDESDLRPHERTLRGPKEDRLALMRATETQTSAVFALWDTAPEMSALLSAVTAAPAFLGGRTDGEVAAEKTLMWPVTDEPVVDALHRALRDARLYVADGHHRYETAVAYARERRAAQPDAPRDADFERCLVYLCAADDPGMTILPTHRLVAPRPGLPVSVADLESVAGEGVDVVPVTTVGEAAHAAALRRSTHHAFGVALRDGAAMVARRRSPGPQASPRDRLDVVVLEEILLSPLGIDAGAIREGALTYTRDVAQVAAQVAAGAAGMGVTVNPATVEETIAIADAGEVMPQKSTYFYPKVPTGIVLAPL
jgi:uncharacterized protein (DUF1015 family)